MLTVIRAYAIVCTMKSETGSNTEDAMGTFRPRQTDGITYHHQIGTNTIWKVSRDTRKGFVQGGWRKRCIRLTRRYAMTVAHGREVVWF